MTFNEWIKTENAQRILNADRSRIPVIDVMEIAFLIGHTEGVTDTLKDYEQYKNGNS